MTYPIQTWVDGAGGGTPIDEDRLRHLELGVFAASQRGFLDTGCGIAATRTTVNDHFNGTVATLPILTAGQSKFAKIRHEITSGDKHYKLVYGNWYSQISGGGATETNGPTNLTIRAAVEYLGVRYQVKFRVGDDFVTSATMAPGAWLIGEVDLNVSAVPGIPLYSLTLATPDGTLRFPYGGTTEATYDYSYTMTTPTPGAAGDPITNGAASGGTNAAGQAFWPMGILAPGATGTVFAVGDSIVAGAGDFSLDTNSGSLNDLGGYVARGIVGVRAWRAGVYGDRHDLMVPSTKRLAMAASCEKVLIALGSNDIAAGQSLATIQTNMISVWTAMRATGAEVSAITISPRTTAVGNNWGSGAQTGATGNGAGSVFVQLRAWMLDGCPLAVTYAGDGSITFVPAAIGAGFPLVVRCRIYQAPGEQNAHPMHPLNAVIDAMTVVLAADGWSWRANTSEPTTTDGIHPSVSAHINMSKLVRNAMPVLDSSEEPPPPSQAGTLPFPLLGWSYDSATTDSSSTFTMTAGSIYLVEVDLRAGFVQTIDFVTTTAATAATMTAAYVGIYDKYRTRLALSADVQTTFENVTLGIKSVSMIAPVGVAAGRYYVAFLGVGQGPIIRGSLSTTGIFNLGRTAPPYRTAIAGTAQATLPTTATGTQTVQSQVPWVSVR